MLKFSQRIALGLALAWPLVACLPASAQTDLSKFPLAKAFPADAFVAVAARANPERKFLDEYWGEVTTAFMDSGILQDAWDMIADSMSDEQLETMEGVHEQFHGLCTKVQWCELFEKEFVHVGRFVTPKPPIMTPYEGVMLGRLDTKRAKENYLAMKAILEEVVKLADAHGAEGAVTVAEIKMDDLTIAGIMPPGASGPIIGVAYWKDVIAVSFGGSTLLPECIDLLSGKSKSPGLISTDRFKEAFASLPPAEDEFTFFDPSRMFGSVSAMIKMFSGMHANQQAAAAADDEESGATAEAEASDDGASAEAAPRAKKRKARRAARRGNNDDAAALGAITKVFDDLCFLDYVASVTWTDGFKVFQQSNTALKPGAIDTPLGSIFGKTAASDKFDRFIPKEAINFSCSSGIDLKALYHYGRSFVEEAIPEGKAMIEKFDRMQDEEWELNIEKDILNLFEGSIITVETPKGWVLMCKVTDEERASARIKNLFQRVNGVLGPDNAVILTPVEITGDVEFTQISHPMMMMMGGLSPPVIGCAEGFLFFGANQKVVKQCIDTANGKHASILKSKRWNAEGLRPASGEKIDSISYTDESKTAENLQALIGGLSMGLGMMGMMAQDLPPEARPILQAIPTMLAKLGPVAGKMDFFLSSASVSTFDGKRWISKDVQNYKKPEPKEEASESADAEEEQ